MWLQILVDFYGNEPPALQLGLANETTEQEHYRNQALLTIVAAFVICPLFPLLVITLWNVFKPRRARHGKRGNELSVHERASSSGASKEKDEGGEAEMASSPQVMISVDGGVPSVRCGSTPGG